MTTTPSPTPGGKNPWRKSETPGHTPKHAPPPKPGTAETIAKLGKKHKGKLLAAAGLAAALALGKGAYTGYEAWQDSREADTAAEEQAEALKKKNETPLKNISIPLTIQVKDGKLSVKWKRAHSDKCGQAHTVSMALGTAEQMRKDRMRLPRADIRITVTAHDQTHTYEADEDVVADGEERESTIGAHLVSGEEIHE